MGCVPIGLVATVSILQDYEQWGGLVWMGGFLPISVAGLVEAAAAAGSNCKHRALGVAKVVLSIFVGFVAFVVLMSLSIDGLQRFNAWVAVINSEPHCGMLAAAGPCDTGQKASAYSFLQFVQHALTLCCHSAAALPHAPHSLSASAIVCEHVQRSPKNGQLRSTNSARTTKRQSADGQETHARARPGRRRTCSATAQPRLAAGHTSHGRHEIVASSHPPSPAS